MALFVCQVCGQPGEEALVPLCRLCAEVVTARVSSGERTEERSGQ